MAKRKAPARRRSGAAPKRSAASASPKRRGVAARKAAPKATARKTAPKGKKAAKSAKPAPRRVAKKAARRAAPKASSARVVRRVTKKAPPAKAPARKPVAKLVKKAGATPSRKLAAAPARAVAATPKVAARPKAVSRPKADVAAAGKKKHALGLDRERRMVGDDDDIVSPTPPSSLNLDRSASSARSGRQELKERYDKHTETSPALTGGDVDADWESAYSTGDEAPGGDNPTPDQNNVDDIGLALGVEYEDNEELEGADKIEERDRHRWEDNPASSDDFDER
jgi:hypothetical protein